MACENILDLNSPRWPNLTHLRFLALEAGTENSSAFFEDLHFEARLRKLFFYNTSLLPYPSNVDNYFW